MITNLAEQLSRDEGKKSSVYQDSRGFWTIGIGICVDARAGCGLDDEEILFLFDRRRKRAEAALSREFPWTDALDDARRGALTNMVFQMGAHGLGEFRQFLAALQQKDYEAAGEHMLDSAWAREQTPARAKRLSEQIKTGVWQ